MRLLISVANATDARAALMGGADIIDAKDPTAGALGAVALSTFRQIRDVVAGRRPLSAALGDASEPEPVEALARAFASAGASFVKIGLAGIGQASDRAALLQAAVRGARAAQSAHDACRVIAVAYADEPGYGSPSSIAGTAAEAGAHGVLLDTMHKAGPGLPSLVNRDELGVWVREARSGGLMVALAGRLAIDDLAFVHDASADIVGLRGAACEGGRTGRVVASKVALLRARCQGEVLVRT